MAQNKSSQSEIDGVQYRRAKLWQIIMVASSGLVGMGFYSLMGMASYSASIGFGIATVAVGGILTFTRIFDAITDPLLAFIYDRVNTRFGKVRILLVSGWLVMVFATLMMYNWAAGKGNGMVVFVLLYVIYIIGYTLYNMTGQTLYALMTNDPKQRPMLGVWSTIFNYVVPISLSMINYVVLLPKYGNYNLEFLAAVCWVTVAVSAVGLILTCIGISEYDKPENFAGTSAKKEKLKLKDMMEVLKNNRPLQCYIASGTSDKIAQQVASQTIISTMLGGIIIGDMSISTTLSTISIIPSILFAVVGAKYAGKHGNKKTIVTWSYISIYVTCATILFFVFLHIGGNTRNISTAMPLMIIYVILTLALNGTKMCVTTGNTAFMADLIDYELDRGGKYIPAVVSGVASLIDKLVSSVSALIATGAVALIGYRETMPQPTDELTGGVFWMTMALMYGLPLIGWVITLIAMRFCALSKEEMIEVQKRIADKKAAAQREVEA
ncbi:MAG: MFS transporter [Blautia sp.]|nr:MFS transporter [Lachnoclostridium sp.]MCM1211487.1 MFS transporter [Blautia sp.]